jgi:hypothetical protein
VVIQCWGKQLPQCDEAKVQKLVESWTVIQDPASIFEKLETSSHCGYTFTQHQKVNSEGNIDVLLNIEPEYSRLTRNNLTQRVQK